MEGRGKLITFEGPDGAGKTTQVRLLAETLETRGYSVLVTREPGGTPLSEAIRDLLLDPRNKEMSPITEALLYAGARAQLVSEVIIPALEAGMVVLCDRFVDSSLAYQGYGRGLDLKMLQTVNKFALNKIGGFFTILLDLPANDGLLRVARMGGRDRLEQEQLTFHIRVREGYLALAAASPERIRVVDAGADVEIVQSRILAEVLACLEGQQQGGLL